MRFSLLVAALMAAPVASAHAQTSGLPAWIHPDSAAKTVLLDLTVTRPTGSPTAQINGRQDGNLQITVPRGWTVKWHWVNEDSTAEHSLVVVAEREKLPQEGTSPVFTNAMTRSLKTGLASGQTDDTSFEADEGGWYWMVCGVPGHAIAGEWISLKVDAAATTVQVKFKIDGVFQVK
jgi:sulfocyanin